jgi:hypothetical protein
VNLKSALIWIALIALVAFGARCSRDPLRTELPFGSTDLSSVEDALAKLAPEDRARVEAYVKRSNGDYLPAGMGDPDMPFTARSFAEAIELEQQWEARQAQEGVAQAARDAERERALAPLREIVSTELADARLESTAEPTGSDASRPAQGNLQGDTPRLVLQLRVRNRGSQDVVQLAGTLRARDREHPLGLSLCYFEIGPQNVLSAYEVREFECAGRQGADEQERAFVEARPGRFSVEWLPRELMLADGRVLKSGVY